MISVLQLRPEAQSHSRMSHQPASSVSNISDSGSEQTRSSLSSMSLGSSISDIDMLLAKRRFVGFLIIVFTIILIIAKQRFVGFTIIYCNIRLILKIFHS